MTEEDRPMSADDALKRGWMKLRRAHLDETNKADERVWEEIGARNHFGPSFEAAVQEAMRRRRR